MEIPEIDVAALAELHRQNVTIIDVRNPDEYEDAHVPGATMIPLPEFAERAHEIPNDGAIYLICAAGGRSLKAAEYLVGQGRGDVTNVAGGTKAWMAAGFPTSTGPNP